MNYNIKTNNTTVIFVCGNTITSTVIFKWAPCVCAMQLPFRNNVVFHIFVPQRLLNLHVRITQSRKQILSESHQGSLHLSRFRHASQSARCFVARDRTPLLWHHYWVWPARTREADCEPTETMIYWLTTGRRLKQASCFVKDNWECRPNVHCRCNLSYLTVPLSFIASAKHIVYGPIYTQVVAIPVSNVVLHVAWLFIQSNQRIAVN